MDEWHDPIAESLRLVIVRIARETELSTANLHEFLQRVGDLLRIADYRQAGAAAHGAEAAPEMRRDTVVVVARFIGHCNVLHATVSDIEGERAVCDAGALGTVTMAASTGIEVGARVALALRPEAIEIAPGIRSGDTNQASMTVIDIRFTGSAYVIGVQAADGQEIEVEAHRREAPARLPAPGEAIAVRWADDALTPLRRDDRGD